MKAFISWSGGKDSCLAYYMAIKEGYNISFLVNNVSKSYRRSFFHGVRENLIIKQAESIDVNLIQNKTTIKRYDTNFKKIIRKIKKEGVNIGIFGDINFPSSKKWVYKICKQTKIKPVILLWNVSEEKIMNDFIDSGFKAFVVSANRKYFNKNWLGTEINKNFVRNIKKLNKKNGVSICGEKGEYHTFVYDGPIFKKKIKIIKGKKVLRRGYWFVDVKDGR